jgi:hypothetical protein
MATLTKAGHGLNLSIWETVLEPADVAVEIGRVFELFHGATAVLFKLPGQFAGVPQVECRFPLTFALTPDPHRR